MGVGSIVFDDGDAAAFAKLSDLETAVFVDVGAEENR